MVEAKEMHATRRPSRDSSSEQHVASFYRYQMGGSSILSHLLFSQKEESAIVASLLLAIQAYHSSKWRMLVSDLEESEEEGIHSKPVLNRIADLYFSKGVQHPLAVQALLFAACLSGGTTTANRQPHLQSGWLTQLCESIMSDTFSLKKAKKASWALSMLSHSCLPSNDQDMQVRTSTIASGVLPFLLSPCCAFSPSITLSTKLHLLCLINNCLSPCSSKNGVPDLLSDLVEAAVKVLIHQGFITWLKDYLFPANIPTSQSLSIDQEQQHKPYLMETLAAEGLMICLRNHPSLTLAAFKDIGLFNTFPALISQSILAPQRLALQIIVAAIDLEVLAEEKRTNDDNTSLSKGSSKAKQRSRNGVSKAQQQQEHRKRSLRVSSKIPGLDEVIDILATSAAWPSVTWLLLHRDHEVQRQVQKFFRFLMNHTIHTFWVEAFIEQGCVPILYSCSQRQEKRSSSFFKQWRRVASVLVSFLQDHLQQPNEVTHLISKVMVITISQKYRSNTAIALLLLSCANDELRQSFVSKGCLSAVLSMLHNPASREAAMSFLAAVDSLIIQEALPSFIKSYMPAVAHDNHDNYSEDGHSEHQEGGDGVWSIGKTDLVICVETLEVHGHKKVIEMACPPAALLSQASRSLKKLLIEAAEKNERPTIQGKYRVWEEIMSHIAQPSSFGKSNYKPELLIEMMTVAHSYGISGLKMLYGVALASHLGPTTAVSIFHAALTHQHAWLAVEAYRVLLGSIDFICSRSTRALPLTIQLIDAYLRAVLVGQPIKL